MTTDKDRLAVMDKLNQQSTGDDDFLRKTTEAGRRYGNSPGADVNLLGMRDLLLEQVDKQLSRLSDQIEERIAGLEQRAARAPQRQTRSTGVSWSAFKAMGEQEQRATLEAVSDRTFAMLFHGKSQEDIQALEARLARVEKALSAENLESFLDNGDA